ncbi:MAG: flagellin [Planctomycetota bacterium]
MALTVNNLGTLSLLNILNRTSIAQENVLHRMATGSKINRGSDDPAGLVALTNLDAELISVDAGIASNQRTDAVLGVADDALGQLASILADVQRLANNTANDAALTADEKAANQAQIDDALASIDRIIANTEFNGKKLLDGTLGIHTTVANAGTITDVKVYSRKSGTTDAALAVKVQTAASNALVNSVMTTSTSEATSFSVQGKLGTAVISVLSTENLSSVAYKIVQAKNQTGVSAVLSGTHLNLWSTTKGSAAFVRTQLITGSGVTNGSDTGVDAVVLVNGQSTAVDGTHVTYNGGGIGVSFEIGTLGAGSTTTLTVKGSGGATFQLGTTADTRATIGIDGVYTYQLGDATNGYLATLRSGESNSLLTDPTQAAEIARVATRQIAQLQGRIGGFQKFQVRTSLNSLTDTKEGLAKAKGVINDVDYAIESAELNRQNILLQSAMSLLGLANQQASQVLALLR